MSYSWSDASEIFREKVMVPESYFKMCPKKENPGNKKKVCMAKCYCQSKWKM